MPGKLFFDSIAWKKKAMAFVTRSHRHLWGKNNEDPQAFLFTRGLKNTFIKEHLLGWNKFAQERPIENWGFQSPPQIKKKLFLTSGIVVPFIVEKELRSVFIHAFDENTKGRTKILPGSLLSTMIFARDSGEKKEKIAIVQDLFDGLFLFQETRALCVMIHPDPTLPLDPSYQPILKNAGAIFIFSAGKKEEDSNRQLFYEFPDQCFHAYQSKEELKEICLKH